MDSRIFLIFGAGLIGGCVAQLVGVPMPFMLGGLLGAASFVIFYENRGTQLPKLSNTFRQVFMALIGAIIGTRFSPELFQVLPDFWISAVALIPFILIVHSGSYLIMRKISGHNRRDAFFATMPAGIIDAVALAEQMGADIKVVATQHFIRVVIVVTAVPLIFFAIDGNAVGSAAGMSMANSNYSVTDVLMLCLVAFVGLGIGKSLNLPASHMMGPLSLGFILSISGLIQLNVPNWLPHLAQFVIGTSLGSQFSGISKSMLIKGFAVGISVGTFMLSVGAAFAFTLHAFVPAGLGALFVSFAAGGLAEMSLIALSLNFNPVIVALHHLCRIVLTVSFCGIFAKRILKL